MIRRVKTGAILAGVAVLAANPAWAARVTLSRQSRAVTDIEIAGGAPAGGLVHEFFVTSDSDLLTIAVEVDVPLYRHSLTSQSTAPEPDLVAVHPAAAATSFVTTPGDTLMLGGGFNGPGPDRGWGDLTNDGPQQNFRFAQLTVGQTGTFSGRVDLRGYNLADSVHYGFASLPFSFTLPGSIGELGLLESEPSYALEYSLEPPPPPALPPVAPNPPPVDVPPTIPEPVVTPPAEAPALPPQAPAIEFPPDLPPPVEAPPSSDWPLTIDLPARHALIDVMRSVNLIPIDREGFQAYFATCLPALNVVTIGDEADLGVALDASVYGLVAAERGDGLVELASVDAAASMAVFATASLAFGNAASIFAAADASGHIPEPDTASLLAVALALGRAFNRRRP